jgi:prepilin peptidase CpaA
MPNGFATGVVLGGVAVAALVDVSTRRIPNALTAVMALGALAAAATGATDLSVGRSVLGLVVGLGAMLPGYAIGATGAGDVKLLAAVGAWVGPAAAAESFVFAAVAGGVLAAAAAYRRGRLVETIARVRHLRRATRAGPFAEAARDPRAAIAYAPAIAIGTALALML